MCGIKTKCKLTRKKGQNKHKLKDLKLTASKAVHPTELSSPGFHLSSSSLRGVPTRLCRVLKEGLLAFVLCLLKMVVIQGFHREPLLGQHYLCQHSGLSAPNLPLCQDPSATTAPVTPAALFLYSWVISSCSKASSETTPPTSTRSERLAPTCSGPLVVSMNSF